MPQPPPFLVNPHLQLRHAPIPPFVPVPNWKFETAHPYGNNSSVWMQLFLPGGGTQMRLKSTGAFNLEQNYDHLEVWCWTNTAWTRVRRYTGTVGPTLNDWFDGHYFYLRLISDSSLTTHGFCLTAEYRSPEGQQTDPSTVHSGNSTLTPPPNLLPLDLGTPLPPLQPVQGWKFETAHPYGNNSTTLSQFSLPPGGSQMRLKTIGEFSLEPNYDYLCVSSRKGSVWQARYFTGQVSPTIDDVFEGDFFQLQFDSDSSVTRYGFCLVALYR